MYKKIKKVLTGEEIEKTLSQPSLFEEEVKELIARREIVWNAILTAIAIAIPLYFYLHNISVSVGIALFVFLVLLEKGASSNEKKFAVLGKLISLAIASRGQSITEFLIYLAQALKDGKITPEEYQKLIELMQNIVGVGGGKK